MNRREFLQQVGLATGAVAGGLIGGGCAGAQQHPVDAIASEPSNRQVAIICDPTDPIASQPPVQWAIGRLCAALADRKIPVVRVEHLNDIPRGSKAVMIAGCNLDGDLDRDNFSFRLGTVPPESVILGQLERLCLVASAADARGLAYAITELAAAVAMSEDALAPFGVPTSIKESPANRVRGIGRLFCSDVEDKPWFNDRGFWTRYLDMLATQRFNRFHLAMGLGYDTSHNIRDSYFYFPYPFLITLPDYPAVRAIGLPDAERDNNLVMLRFISDQCARRGIDFQLGLWGHQYEFIDSPNVNYPMAGLNRDNHASYCRDALLAVLKACPNITGVTFRIHGESGVPEGSYDFWQTVFDGITRCGRTVGIEMHAKGSDQKIIDIALATKMPVTLAPKYWSEHMGLPYTQTAIRSLELPRENRKDEGFFARSNGSRSFLRYGYGDLLTEDRKYQVVHRMWPGTQRVLLWGDWFHAAAYGRASGFCGSDGAELFEPMSFKGRMGTGQSGGRQGYADDSLKTTDDWEKYIYAFTLWGRMLYNPDTPYQVWQRVLSNQLGKETAAAVGPALAHASRILPLITTALSQSASYNAWWVEMSWNMPIVDPARRHPYSDTPAPKRFGMVSPLDPQMFIGIDASIDQAIKGEVDGRYTPAEVAGWLDRLAGIAFTKLEQAGQTKVEDADHAAFRRASIDIAIQAGLGKFFASKIRAALLWAVHLKTGSLSVATAAVAQYQLASKSWSKLAETAAGVYAKNIAYGPGYFQSGNWGDRLPAINADIADMANLMQQRQPLEQPPIDAAKLAAIVAAVTAPPQRPTWYFAHSSPAGFTRGQAVTLQINLPGDRESVHRARLHYRHVNQAERFITLAMNFAEPATHGFTATIPAAYTDSPFPLQYYFEFDDGGSKAALHPGFNPDLSNQPYFVIRQEKAGH